MDDEIFMKGIWIISKIFGSPDLLVCGAHRAYRNVFLSTESWAILGGGGYGGGGDVSKHDGKGFPQAWKEK